MERQVRKTWYVKEEDTMTTLFVAKQYIKGFISKYEVYLKPLLKLVLALTALMIINGKIGYMHRLDSISIVLILAADVFVYADEFHYFCSGPVYNTASIRIILRVRGDCDGAVSGNVPALFQIFTQGHPGGFADADVLYL